MSGSALASCAVVGKIRTTEPLRTWAQGAVTVGAHSMGFSAYTNIKPVCVLPSPVAYASDWPVRLF